MRLIFLILILTLCSSLTAGILILPVEAVAPRIPRQWEPADLVDAAALWAGTLSKEQACTVQVVDLSKYDFAVRARKLQALGYVVNSWSTNDLLVTVQAIPGTELALAWFDWRDLRQREDKEGLRKLLLTRERLGDIGSGPAPFPESFFHVVENKEEEVEEYKTVEYGYYYDGYGRPFSDPGDGRTWKATEKRQELVKGKKRKRRVALSPAANKASNIGLAALLDTNFPIFEYRWMVTNGLTEPRYHELLGVDDSEKSVLKLADADERLADDIGSQLRGTVLFSTVGRRNRVTERTATRIKHGRGSFHRSFDFKTSIDAQDVLKDTLVVKADAHEVIWTLPNGLQGFYVSDNKFKRLDKADADIAASHNRRWEDPQVRTAFMCMDCHLREKGWIEVDDEVREFARREITLLVQAFEKEGGKERDRGRRIRQKYLQEDVNELIRADQALVESSVRAATGGLTCAETHREVMDTIEKYLQERVTGEMLARELGVNKARLFQAIESLGRGADHTLTGLRAGRVVRRDQLEPAFGQIATALYLMRGL